MSRSNVGTPQRITIEPAGNLDFSAQRNELQAEFLRLKARKDLDKIKAKTFSAVSEDVLQKADNQLFSWFERVFSLAIGSSEINSKNIGNVEFVAEIEKFVARSVDEIYGKAPAEKWILREKFCYRAAVSLYGEIVVSPVDTPKTPEFVGRVRGRSLSLSSVGENFLSPILSAMFSPLHTEKEVPKEFPSPFKLGGRSPLKPRNLNVEAGSPAC